MKRTNEFGQTFAKEKVDEKEVDQPATSTDDESKTNTSKTKKRLVKLKQK